MSALALMTANVRWFLLLALDHTRGMGASEDLLLWVVRAVYPHATRHDLRPSLEYLEGFGLVDLVRVEHPWRATLTDRGHGVCTYAMDCGEGVARPVRMFETGAPVLDPPCHAVHTTLEAIRGDAEYPRCGSGSAGLSELLTPAGDDTLLHPAGTERACHACKGTFAPFPEGREYPRCGSAPAGLSAALRRSDDARA